MHEQGRDRTPPRPEPGNGDERLRTRKGTHHEQGRSMDPSDPGAGADRGRTSCMLKLRHLQSWRPPGGNTGGTPTAGTPGGHGHQTGHKPNKNAPKAPVTAGTPPAAMDLTQYDPPVGDHGQVGSCTAWATGYYLRGWYAKRDGYYPAGGSPSTGSFAAMYLYAQIVRGSGTGPRSGAYRGEAIASERIRRNGRDRGESGWTVTPRVSNLHSPRRRMR